jgi:hypothetical protein
MSQKSQPLVYNDCLIGMGATSGTPPLTALVSSQIVRIPSDRYLHLTAVSSLVVTATTPAELNPGAWKAMFELHHQQQVGQGPNIRSLIACGNNGNVGSWMVDVILNPGDGLVATWRQYDVGSTMFCHLHGTWHLL